ncbi:unnamed protein product, partial [Meganyctiphanes norvegica]
MYTGYRFFYINNYNYRRGAVIGFNSLRLGGIMKLSFILILTMASILAVSGNPFKWDHVNSRNFRCGAWTPCKPKYYCDYFKNVCILRWVRSGTPRNFKCDARTPCATGYYCDHNITSMSVFQGLPLTQDWCMSKMH